MSSFRTAARSSVSRRARTALSLLAAAMFVPGAGVMARVEERPVGPADLTVVTWNMNAGRGNLSALVADLDAGRLAAGSESADVVLLLQEAVEEDLPRVRKLAGPRGWSVFYVPVHHDGRWMRGNAIVSSRPIAGTRIIALPRERQPRSAAAGVITIAGQELFVVSAHLENRVSWWKAGLLSDDARRRQAEALVRALPAGAGIVGGDFNTWLGVREPAWRLLARRFDDTPAARTPTFAARLVLDHIFVDLPAGWHAATRVLDDSYRSDHHPVLAVLSAGSSTRGLCASGCLSASSHVGAR